MPWNNSTFVDRKDIPDARHFPMKTNLVYDSLKKPYNFRSEVLSKPEQNKSRTVNQRVENPIHPNLVGKQFNLSNEVDQKLNDSLELKRKNDALENTNQLNLTFTKDDSKRKTFIQRHDATLDRIRTRKINNEPFDDSNFFKKQRDNEIEEEISSMRKDLTEQLRKTAGPRNVKCSFYHDGVWDDEKGFWSCCMNENKQNKGCMQKKEDRDRWKY
eukprot:TRINITY_DN92_c0_g1_i1.p1 TRINITY_DN92_c0_g1~~TRINITY_DN92_c0_g1_i1.p1  ORF type:complete len:224 (+),score=68.01 TRINITY_DN92_c0_g1_i1:29-673(+)